MSRTDLGLVSAWGPIGGHMKKLLGFVLVFALGFVAGIVWYRDSGGASPTDGGKGGSATATKPTGPANSDVLARVKFSNVTVAQDDLGKFVGSIKLSNNTSRSMPVLVTVHIYDGPDNVADLSEMTTMKPQTTSTVSLTGVDDYQEFTDTTVDLLPLG
jgi:hypothetical protein